MRKNIIYIVLLGALFSSCAKDTSNYFGGEIAIIDKFRYEGEVESTPLILLDSMSHGSVAVFDSILITTFSSRKGDLFGIYNLHSKELLLSMGNIGRAGNEYLMPKFNTPYQSKDNQHLMINTFDAMAKYLQIDLTESLQQQKMVVSRREDLGKKYFRQFDYNSKIFVLPNDDKLVKLDAYQKDIRDPQYDMPKYLVVGSNDKSREIVLFPNPMKIADNQLSIVWLHNSYCDVSPDGTKMVDAMSYCDLVSIIDIPTGKVKGLQGVNSTKFGDFATISVGELGTKSCYAFNVHASDDYFFVSNLDIKIDDLINIGSTSASSIHIYDWEGNPLAKLKIKDGLISSMFYDKANKILYAICSSDEVDIIYYDLKDVMGKINQ